MASKKQQRARKRFKTAAKSCARQKKIKYQKCMKKKLKK